jgi:hypothetical protein
MRIAPVCLLAVLALPSRAQVDQQRAQSFFNEARALCERDAGKLWGVSVCAPMVMADRRTQTIAISQPAPDTTRPQLLGLVNAPLQWGGTTWAAYVWDDVVSRTARQRNELLLHELFHIAQVKLGLRAPALLPEHLDALEGRYWFRLELRALGRALRTSGAERTLAVRDALTFRQARRARYPNGDEAERAQEITEGSASYAGTALAAGSPSEAITSALDVLANAEAAESFVRTFAYASIPAYGVLLDAASPGWPRRLRPTDDFGALLGRAFAVEPSPDPATSAAGYGGTELRIAEEARDRERQQRLTELRQRFVEGPVLVIPGGGSGMSNSRGAVVIPGMGTVFFGSYRATGTWGTLEAEKGVLVGSDGSTRRVAAPTRMDDSTFTGDGWTFKLSSGWIVRDGARRGDYEVVRKQP